MNFRNQSGDERDIRWIVADKYIPEIQTNDDESKEIRDWSWSAAPVCAADHDQSRISLIVWPLVPAL